MKKAIVVIIALFLIKQLLLLYVSNAKNIFDKQDISFLMDTDDAVEYLNAHYEFYNIDLHSLLCTYKIAFLSRKTCSP